jgi:DNA-binding response OmpR family regulator
MLKDESRRLLLLTDDHFFAETIGTYVRGDRIEVTCAASMDEAIRSVGTNVDGLLIDLAKRGISGEAIISLTFRAKRTRTPLLIMSSQPRRDLAEFAAVVRADDVVSKTERMGAIAARLRMWISAKKNEEIADGFEIPELAVASL